MDDTDPHTMKDSGSIERFDRRENVSDEHTISMGIHSALQPLVRHFDVTMSTFVPYIQFTSPDQISSNEQNIALKSALRKPGQSRKKKKVRFKIGNEMEVTFIDRMPDDASERSVVGERLNKIVDIDPCLVTDEDSREYNKSDRDHLAVNRNIDRMMNNIKYRSPTFRSDLFYESSNSYAFAHS